MRWLFGAITLLLTACAAFPELEGTIDDDARNAPYPRLVNIDDLTNADTATTAAPFDLQGRIDRLNSKADSLRAQSISN